MRYTPHTPAEIDAMLAAIGAESIDDLFADVPRAQRFPRLDLPDGLSEQEVAALFRDLAQRNGSTDNHSCFLGAGAYHHYTPALIPHLLFRSELYTAYTPYQPEVSQGTLQTIFEFQTMVARLFGMEVANASMYDGSTALAEAALMAARLRRGRGTIAVSEAVHPEYREVLATYLSGIGLRITTIPTFDRTTGRTEPRTVAGALDDDTAAVLVQYPNFLGVIEPVAELGELAHAAGALSVVSADPIAMAVLRPPGELGADIATAEGQPLGIPLFYGGPYVGLLATSMRNVRQMPGRLAGVAYDGQGPARVRPYPEAPRAGHSAREGDQQHLHQRGADRHRGDHLPRGARPGGTARGGRPLLPPQPLPGRPASASWRRCRPGSRRPFFRECVVRPPVPPAELNRRLWQRQGRASGGLDLARFDLGLDGCWLLTATELNTRAAIDRLVETVAS